MSRNCDDALANLYLYLDSELDQLSKERIRTHLQACGGCSGPFDFEMRLRAVVRDRLDVEVPEEVVVRLWDALRGEASR